MSDLYKNVHLLLYGFSFWRFSFSSLIGQFSIAPIGPGKGSKIFKMKSCLTKLTKSVESRFWLVRSRSKYVRRVYSCRFAYGRLTIVEVGENRLKPVQIGSLQKLSSNSEAYFISGEVNMTRVSRPGKKMRRWSYSGRIWIVGGGRTLGISRKWHLET